MTRALPRAAGVVLMLAPADDVHALTVARCVERLGAEPLLLDTARFPAEWRLSFRAGGDVPGTTALTVGGRRIAEEEIRSVWYRRPGVPGDAPVAAGRVARRVAGRVDGRVRQFCRAEAGAAIDGWLHALGARVVNTLASESAADEKPYQLRLAEQVGLRVPPTLVSNDPAAVADFYAACEGRVVYKILTATPWQITETRRMERRHLAGLHRLRSAPVIFQSLVEGTDVRATVVDDELFPVEILPHHPGARLDWRLDGAPTVRPHALPDDVAARLVALRRALGLRYAAMDLRRRPDGEYAFFEVNPSGQFLFAEIFAGHPIAAAVAGALVGAAPARPARRGRVRRHSHREPGRWV